jgi:hypothetical protein
VDYLLAHLRFYPGSEGNAATFMTFDSKLKNMSVPLIFRETSRSVSSEDDFDLWFRGERSHKQSMAMNQPRKSLEYETNL